MEGGLLKEEAPEGGGPQSLHHQKPQEGPGAALEDSFDGQTGASGTPVLSLSCPKKSWSWGGRCRPLGMALSMSWVGG